jgi:hypothetical protein
MWWTLLRARCAGLKKSLEGGLELCVYLWPSSFPGASAHPDRALCTLAWESEGRTGLGRQDHGRDPGEPLGDLVMHGHLSPPGVAEGPQAWQSSLDHRSPCPTPAPALCLAQGLTSNLSADRSDLTGQGLAWGP